MTHPPPPTTDLKDTLEEMRASVAARGARKGLAGALQAAMLKFLEVLLALLTDFRDGRLAAPVVEDTRVPTGPLCGPILSGAGAGETASGQTRPWARRAQGRKRGTARVVMGFAHRPGAPSRRPHWAAIAGRAFWRSAGGMRPAGAGLFPPAKYRPPCRAGPRKKTCLMKRVSACISFRYSNVCSATWKRGE